MIVLTWIFMWAIIVQNLRFKLNLYAENKKEKLFLRVDYTNLNYLIWRVNQAKILFMDQINIVNYWRD
jgi:hypothetical protein